jgi:hypothetical protein
MFSATREGTDAEGTKTETELEEIILQATGIEVIVMRSPELGWPATAVAAVPLGTEQVQTRLEAVLPSLRVIRTQTRVDCSNSVHRPPEGWLEIGSKSASDPNISITARRWVQGPRGRPSVAFPLDPKHHRPLASTPEQDIRTLRHFSFVHRRTEPWERNSTVRFEQSPTSIAHDCPN